jgi:hypothetical protein
MVDELREIRRYRHALNIAIAADVGMTLTNEDCKMLEYLLFGLLSEREANATLRRELTQALSDLAHSVYACPHCQMAILQCGECVRKVRMQG